MSIRHDTTLAVGKTFLASLGGLSKSDQGKVRNFIEKFSENPRATGINLEAIRTGGDRLYSARVNGKYRVIVAYDEKSGVYLLLYVANHDDAYKWAEHKRIDINHHTKTIQVYDSIEPQTPAVPAATSPGPGTNNPVQTVPTATKATAPSSMQPSPQPAVQVRKGPLPETFRELDERTLLRLGVPEPYTALIQTASTFEQLDQWFNRLPDDTVEYLRFLSEGESIDDVLELAQDATTRSDLVGLDHTINIDQPRAGDDHGEEEADDFRAALATYGTQENFVVVKGGEDLKRLFDAPLEQWRVFLHPSQRTYVDRTYHGPFRLLGGAGTGKTVVAMHRAKQLAARLVRDHSQGKVLFTTFNVNLATDIHANLRLICTSEELKRIEVTNIDRLVSRRLRDAGYDYRVVYQDDTDAIWARALRDAGTQAQVPRGVDFLRDEWEQVICAQNITSVQQYLKASRRGRGTRLGRAQKVAVWKTVEEFKKILRAERHVDINMATDIVTDMLKGRNEKAYAHVVVDEGQDFAAPTYRLIRALVGEHDDDIFIVGDAQQRIYGKTVILSQCGINVRGRARRLRINYRTTEQIRAAADRIFDTQGPDVAAEAFQAVAFSDLTDQERTMFDDLEGSDVTEDGSYASRSLVDGPLPLTERFPSRDDERRFVVDWITQRCSQVESIADDNRKPIRPEDICIVVPSNYRADDWEEYIERHAHFDAYRLGPEAEDRQREGVRIATMHRVKGLEFDVVIVADVNRGEVPSEKALEHAADEVSKREITKQARSLLYVALTRARKEAVMTGLQ